MRVENGAEVADSSLSAALSSVGSTHSMRTRLPRVVHPQERQHRKTTQMVT